MIHVMKKYLLLFPFLLFAVACTTNQSNQTSEAEDQNYDYDVEARLEEMGITLGEPSPPTENYVKAVRTGDLIFLSGHGPVKPDGGLVTGKLGTDLTVKEGQEAARLTGIDLLTTLKSELEDLNDVEQIVKVTGMVNASTDFTQQSQVVNGCSDLMTEVFGDRGKHARAAVGMGSLPGNIPTEIEMIVEVE